MLRTGTDERSTAPLHHTLQNSKKKKKSKNARKGRRTMWKKDDGTKKKLTADGCLAVTQTSYSIFR